MSDAPAGPGWWQASDGRWYPPQDAPPPPPGPPVYVPQQYGRPEDSFGAYPAGGPAPMGAPGTAVGALVASILAWVTCPFVAAIVALVLASKASNEINAVPGRDGRGMVTAARIISIVHLVLLVPVVLLAIALPTFFGAQERAQDRAAQSDLRNALTAAKTLYADTMTWPSTDQLTSLEPGLRFEPADGIVNEGVIDVSSDDLTDTGSGEPIIAFGTQSESGTCYYLASSGTGRAAFAETESCLPPDAVEYFEEGWED